MSEENCIQVSTEETEPPALLHATTNGSDCTVPEMCTASNGSTAAVPKKSEYIKSESSPCQQSRDAVIAGTSLPDTVV